VQYQILYWPKIPLALMTGHSHFWAPTTICEIRRFDILPQKNCWQPPGNYGLLTKLYVFQLRVHIHGEWLELGSTRGKPVVPGCDLEEVGLVGSKKVERTIVIKL